MDELISVLLFLFAVGLALLPLALLIRQSIRVRTLNSAVAALTKRVAALESRSASAPAPTSTAQAATPTVPPPVIIPTPRAPAVPPPLPVVSPVAPVSPSPAPPPAAAAPPPIPARAPKPVTPAIDWEAFLGVKLFSWIGGFVLFLGIVFLVKYSFQNNLITPAMRVVLGAIVGAGLVAGGWFTGRRNYRIPGQSLCATGVLVLYATIFGAHEFYSLITLPTAFVLMSAVTIAAFLLAVNLNAQVVVVLGLVGGFLTPPLLASGDENPALLFGYVALLNAGIAAVALRKSWDYLLVLAAIGTVLMEFAWLPVNDARRASVGYLIFLGLQAQFLGFAFLRQKQEPRERWSTLAAGTVGFASLLFGLCLLSYKDLANWPAFFFSFTFLADIGLLALAVLRPNPARLAAPAAAGVFFILSAWTATNLHPQFLWWALGAYLLFAVLHSGFSVWPKRADTKTLSARWQSYIPALALALLFLCVLRGETSFAVWACVLLVNVIAVMMAATSRSVGALVLALLATLGTAALWIVTAPPIHESVGAILGVVAVFGLFFSGASTFLSRQVGIGATDHRRNVPAIAAAMPFLLLLMLIAKLPIGAPSAVFSVALLLAIVLLGLGIVSRTSWVAAVALAFTWAVERAWHFNHFDNSYALIALGWYVVFFLVFAAYPFFAAEERTPLPWAIGALSGVLHFTLIYELISVAYPHLRTGLLPALFILPYALGVVHLIRKRGVVPASGDARLAWQGGAALLFVSLIFPIQFDREWITLGWAIEGFALLVLFRSVPHRGLRLVGTALLCVAFVRLALNPAIFEYHPRASVRIWNWYLYAYGITCLCLFGGARAVQQFRETELARVVPRLLYVLATVLAFLLLNIEIADYFSIGPTLTFSFTGNFARDMTYSIAWALFALALLLVGMRRKAKWVRYAGVGLLLVTLAKLFLNDFANLGPLYRIGAFIGVAVILIVASFVYQRFLAPEKKAGTETVSPQANGDDGTTADTAQDA